VLLGDAEDEIAAVQAGGVGAGRRLLVNGTGMTLLTVDAKLMAYLPIITRPQSQRMLVICFGMGSSYRAGLRAGLLVDGVELVPSVPKMFHWYHADAGKVLADPRGHLIITDGRNYVELSDRKYDLIVVDPPPPIESSGTSVLYSREFYAASARRLNAAGVMMEWIPYELSVDEFRSHVRTFADVFPHVLVAFGPGHYGVFMLGSDQAIAIEPDRVREVLSRRGVLEDLGDTPDAPAATFEEWVKIINGLRWIDGARVGAFAGQASPIRDDHPVVEYFLLRRSFNPSSPRASEEALRAATPP
jgi:spermidine synthase